MSHARLRLPGLSRPQALVLITVLVTLIAAIGAWMIISIFRGQLQTVHVSGEFFMSSGRLDIEPVEEGTGLTWESQHTRVSANRLPLTMRACAQDDGILTAVRQRAIDPQINSKSYSSFKFQMNEGVFFFDSTSLSSQILDWFSYQDSALSLEASLSSDATIDFSTAQPDVSFLPIPSQCGEVDIVSCTEVDPDCIPLDSDLQIETDGPYSMDNLSLSRLDEADGDGTIFVGLAQYGLVPHRELEMRGAISAVVSNNRLSLEGRINSARLNDVQLLAKRWRGYHPFP